MLNAEYHLLRFWSALTLGKVSVGLFHCHGFFNTLTRMDRTEIVIISIENFRVDDNDSVFIKCLYLMEASIAVAQC